MNQYPDWAMKYIEYRSDITESYTDLQLAKILGISKQTICNFKRTHPDLEERIGQKLERQMSQIRNKAFQQLFARMGKSDRALQIALEMTGLYTPRTDNTTTIKSMDAEAKRKHIKALVNSLLKGGEDGDNTPKTVDSTSDTPPDVTTDDNPGTENIK